MFAKVGEAIFEVQQRVELRPSEGFKVREPAEQNRELIPYYSGVA